MPFVGTGQHMDIRLAGLQRVRHDGGQVIFALHRVDGQAGLQERGKTGLGLLHVGGGEAPQVHRDNTVGRQVGPALAAVLAVMDAVSVRLDAGALGHADEVAALVGHADAAADTAIGADRVAQQEADHGPGVAVPVGVGAQVVVDELEALRAVVVVGVDDRKRRVADGLLGHENGMGGAPGLDAALRHGKALGQLFQLLVGVADLEPGAHGTGTDGLFKRLLDLVLDDKDDGLEPGAAGIVQAVVEDGLAGRADGVDLFESAVAAAHTGGHDNEDRFGRHRLLLLLLRVTAL